MTPQTYVFFGRSGSGKGTQAKLLIEYLEKQGTKVLYFETGNGLRKFAQGDSVTARLVQESIDKGELLPIFMPVYIWTNFLIENYTGHETLVLDGIARRIEEAPILDSALHFYGKISPIKVIVINTSKEWVTKLLLERGRADDSESGIAKRSAWFDTEVRLVIEYFKQNNEHYEVIEVNGEQTIREVHQEILKKVGI